MNTLNSPARIQIRQAEPGRFVGKKETCKQDLVILFKAPDVTRKEPLPSLSDSSQSVKPSVFAPYMTTLARFYANTTAFAKRAGSPIINIAKTASYRIKSGGYALAGFIAKSPGRFGRQLSNRQNASNRLGKVAGVWISRGTTLAIAVCLVIGVQWIMSGPPSKDSTVPTSDEVNKTSKPAAIPIATMAPRRIDAVQSVVAISEPVLTEKTTPPRIEPLAVQSQTASLRTEAIRYESPIHEQAPRAVSQLVTQRGITSQTNDIANRSYDLRNRGGNYSQRGQRPPVRPYPQTQANGSTWTEANQPQRHAATQRTGTFPPPPVPSPANRTSRHDGRMNGSQPYQNGREPIGVLQGAIEPSARR